MARTQKIQSCPKVCNQALASPQQMLMVFATEELSEEDQQLKSELEMLVERLKVEFLELRHPRYSRCSVFATGIRY